MRTYRAGPGRSTVECQAELGDLAESLEVEAVYLGSIPIAGNHADVSGIYISGTL